jgi:hypothetical protein
MTEASIEELKDLASLVRCGGSTTLKPGWDWKTFRTTDQNESQSNSGLSTHRIPQHGGSLLGGRPKTPRVDLHVV